MTIQDRFRAFLARYLIATNPHDDYTTLDRKDGLS